MMSHCSLVRSTPDLRSHPDLAVDPHDENRSDFNDLRRPTLRWLLVLFGSDGGGEAYAFDIRTASLPIVMVPFIGMELQYARPVADNILEFLQKLKG